jgi:hypothetical protein
LRVVRSELDELVRTGAVTDAIGFPGGRSLAYRLQVQPGTKWSAVLDERGIAIGMPKDEAERWFRPEQVGCQSDVALDGGRVLSLLIEKDFPCLVERPGEDDSDAFPRPADEPARTC